MNVRDPAFKGGVLATQLFYGMMKCPSSFSSVWARVRSTRSSRPICLEKIAIETICNLWCIGVGNWPETFNISPGSN